MATQYVWNKYKLATQLTGTLLDSEYNYAYMPNNLLYYGDTVECVNYDTAETIYNLFVNSGWRGYYKVNTTVFKIKAVMLGAEGDYIFTVNPVKVSTSYVKGEFVEQVFSRSADTYPTDGSSGDYWYVYDGVVEPKEKHLFAMVDGVKRETAEMFCTVDVVSREIMQVLVTVNGVAQEVFAKASSLLPDGYTLLDYIQSHGTEHIDLGVKPNQNTRIVFDFENTGDYSANSGTFATLFGARDGTSVNAFSMWMKQTGEVYPQYGSVAYNANGNFSVDLNARRIYELNKNVATVGDESITCKTAAFSTANNLYLFTTNNNGTVEIRKAVGKGYSCQVYDGAVLIRDCVACKNPESEYGLYDLVYGEFHGNAGTGAFTGSDVEIISFTIDGDAYRAENGMTWAEWCASDYNVAGFFVDSAGRVNAANTFWVCYPETMSVAYETEAITSGYAYITAI